MGPTRAYINHSNLLHNYNLIKKAVAPAKVMCVVKANAYGHDSVAVSKTLVENGVEYLGVAFAEEGIELRKAGIDTPILVFGAQLADFLDDHLEYNLDITLTSEHQTQILTKLCREKNKIAKVHIKIDTGMNRVGFLVQEAKKMIDRIFAEPCIQVIGVYSHLSSSDEEDLTYTRGQIERFNQIKSYITETYSAEILFHLANSGAIMRLPESYHDMVRPGVMLYGNPPGPDFRLDWDLEEVMSFVSRVTLIKTVDAGEPVSYSRRYYTKAKTNLAVIPVGYADGYNRHLTNKGSVLIRGKRHPVAGTVCMDQIIVDLGSETDIQVGDDVVLMGQQINTVISNVEISRILNTIPYEITCAVSRRVPRIHLK